MDTSINRSFHIAGLVVASVLIGSVLYVSLDVLSYRPDLRPLFRTGLCAEVAATLLFLPLLIIEDAAKAKKLSLSDFVQFRISRGLRALSLILAVLGIACPLAQKEIFLTSVIFVIYPTTLLALACGYSLISDLIFRRMSKNTPAN